MYVQKIYLIHIVVLNFNVLQVVSFIFIHKRVENLFEDH